MISHFTLEDAQAVIAFPLVERIMRRPFRIDVDGYTSPAQWELRGQVYPVLPFRVLRELVEHSVLTALAEAQGRELGRLLILLKMTAVDDDAPGHAVGVARAAEEYAVRMQFGQVGLDSYNAFMRTQVETGEVP